MTAKITEAHLESYLRDERELSAENVRRIIKAIKTIQTVWNISEPSEENAILLKQAMRQRGRSANTIRIYLWSMKYWSMANGGNINFNAVQLPKPEHHVVHILDYNLVKQMVNDVGLSLRDRAIIMLFAVSACRLGELVSIKVGDVDFVKHTILIHDHKTKKEKIAPIPSAYWSLLTTYMRARSEWLTSVGKRTDALFISANTGEGLSGDGVRQLIYRLGKLYGVKMHPHMFRHTAVTWLLERLTPEEVMCISGHSTASMLHYYTHVRTQNVIEKVSGLSY